MLWPEPFFEGDILLTLPVFLKNWNGLPDPAEAAPAVIKRYLSVYGPATPETFDAWLSRNSNKKSTLKGWFASLGEQIVEVRVKDETRYLLAEHEDELAATQPSRAHPPPRSVRPVRPWSWD